jgi:hypothetical protein
MGFLPIFYAGTFFFIALCGYVCLSVVAGMDALGKRVFLSILAFGASSYAGFLVVILAISFSPFKAILEGRAQPLIFGLAYILPGLVGGWVSLKGFGALRRPKRQG